MTEYENTNRGVLFRNKDKRDDRDPLYRGSINVGGQEYWLDAWVNTAKKSGEKFMSLRVKPKQASQVRGGSPNPPARTRDDFDSGDVF